MKDKRFGYFDDDNREYVITDPKTPWPWINYLGNEDFFSLISNTAGGYSFYKDAKFRRITRYRYNNVPMDNGGRYFYINEGGNVWSPTWKPCKTALDSYECRHGMSYTRITGAKDGIEASLLFFVPLKTWGEVQKLTLRNTSAKVRKLKLFSFAEWCLWNAATDMENFQRNFSTGEVEVDGSVIYHKTEYKERRNHYAFYSVNTPVDGFDTDRETFVGLYNEFADPERVVEGRPGNSIAHGWSPISSPSSTDARETYFIYLNLLHDQSWEKVIENMAAITGYTDRRDLELKCMQIFSAVEFPIILESNSKNSFITRYTDAATLERYVDILLDNASRPQEKNNEYLKEILHGAK